MPKDEKKLEVKPFTRTLKTRAITFVCNECGQEVTEERYPGPTPKYCEECTPVVRRRQARERQQRARDKKALEEQAG